MGSRFPRLRLHLFIVTACLLLAVVVLGRGLPSSQAVVDPLPFIEPAPILLSQASSSPAMPDALVGMSVSGGSVIPPTPTPMPRIPKWPDWVKVTGPSVLRGDPDPDRPEDTRLATGTYLKVVKGEGDRYRVYFGGDVEDDPREGWVSKGDVAVSPAPAWVMTWRGTALVKGDEAASSPIAWLPTNAVMEVLEDRGDMLRVFYLGDGRAWQPAEGWVNALDLAPAGATILAQERGLRLLGRSDVASLTSGDGVWLRVPYRTQLDGSPAADANCGPSSIGMALEAFGTLAFTGNLRDLANKFQGTVGDDVGFRIEHLRSVVQQLGLKGLDLYSISTDFRKWTLDDVRAHLKQGHPVIPQLKYRLLPGREGKEFSGDHYIVITGMKGDDFVYNDSVDVDGPGFGRVMSGDALKKAWAGSDYPFAAFAVARE